MSFHINAAMKSWGNWETKNIYDKLLWCWVFFRILMYFLQLPIRYRIAKLVWQAHRQNRRSEKRLMALAMLRTWEWTVVQLYSRALLAWVFATIVGTWYLAHVFEDQVHRTDVLTYCWMNVFLLCTQTFISVRWLRKLLDEGWVDSTEITIAQFRQSSDQFRSLAVLKQLLHSRAYPFNRLPRNVNLQTHGEDKILEEDPIHCKIYFPTHCAICKSGFSNSISTPLSWHKSTETSNAPTYVCNGDIATPWLLDTEECVTLLPCGHIFHVTCIESWLSLKHSRCPYCNVSTVSDRLWTTLKHCKS